MDDRLPLGARLRQLRQSRGLTLGAVAREAGIGAVTLSRWETGAHRPGEAALGRLLDALGVRGAERAPFVDHLSPEHWPQVLARDDLGPPVAVGGVVRALRLRRGTTQADLARALGVGQATVARWEGGDRVPDGAQLAAICAAMDASVEERAALRLARNVGGPDEADPDAMLDRIHASPRALHEVQMLAYAADRWRRAARDPREAEPFGAAVARVAHLYFMEGRAAEATEWANRALRLGDDPGMRTATTPAFYVLKEQQSLGNVAPTRAVALTRTWLEGLPDSMARVWMLQNLAWSLGRAGEAREAHEALSRSMDLVERLDLGHAFHEPSARAALYVALDEPEKVIETLSGSEGVYGADEFRLLGLLGMRESPPEGLVDRVRARILTEAPYEASRRLKRLDRALAREISRSSLRNRPTDEPYFA